MATANDLNISQAGVVVFDGTATFTGRTLTAGTGIVITNGSGVAGNPIIASSSGGSFLTSFQPNAILTEFDDFIEGAGSFKLAWTPFGTLGTNYFWTNGTGNHPGIFSLTPTAGNKTGLYLRQIDTSGNPAINPYALGGGVLSINWVIQLSSLSAGGNTYRFSCGLADDTTVSSDSSDDFINGVYFQYTDTANSGNWQIKSTAASVTTTGNTATAAGTSFVTLSIIVNADATSVAYYINNVQVANSPITTNIPTAALTPFFIAINTAGTTPQINADLFYIYQVLTVPRPGPSLSQTVIGSGQLIRQYTATAVSYQVLNTDSIIGITSNASARTITMPNASLVTGQQWTVKDEAGTAQSSNNITISGNGVNINGSSTFVINTNYGSVDLYYNGSQFYTI